MIKVRLTSKVLEQQLALNNNMKEIKGLSKDKKTGMKQLNDKEIESL